MAHGKVEVSNPAEQRVLDLCNAFSRLDVDVVLEFFSEDAIYEKIPMALFDGKVEIRGTLEEFFAGAESLKFEVLNMASRGNTVLMERVTHFETKNKTISLRIMAIFELRDDGKIISWRDYYDRVQAGIAPGDGAIR